MELLRYETDARSIPTLNDTNGVTGISCRSLFSVTDGNLLLKDPDSGNVTMGTHMQYKVRVK